MIKFAPLLLLPILLTGCLVDWDAIQNLFAEKHLSLNIEKAVYSLNETIVINATGTGREFFFSGVVPFKFSKYDESAERWGEILVGAGPNPRYECKNNERQVIAKFARERLTCRELVYTEYSWSAEYWKPLSVQCGGEVITEHTLIRERGDYRVELNIYSDEDCSNLNQTLFREFKIT